MADGFHSVAYAIVNPAAAMHRVRRVLTGIAMTITVAVTLLVLVGERAAADDASQVGNWSVVELRGSAYSRLGEADGGQWRALKPGAAIAPGTIVRTGQGGSLLLANRLDRIRLSANSELELPRSEGGDAATRVIHWIGRAFFDVGRRPSPQFEVNTPYLVAVVKGTAFTTTVSGAGSAIKVTEGIVGVASARGGASIDVAAGETASVSASDGGTVSPGDLSDASAPGQGDAGMAPSTATTAAAADAPVDGDTVSGAGRGSTARSGGPGGGNGNGGDRGGAKGSQS
ncbi:MAG: FecR family protein, partial [Dongiaceae bacterium]